MHIPDGYLSPQTYVVLDAAVVPIWALAARRVRATLQYRQVPLMALGAAFSFVIMMFNIPVIGGSTGHAVGATLVAIVLGPWAAVLSLSIAVVIQALFFGDGGITAIGANVFNMAVVMPLLGYYLYRLIAGDSPSNPRRIAASGIAAYVSMVAGAILAGVEFGIQPLIAHTAAGVPLYAPYPLKIAVTAMAGEHLLFFGWVEALATMGVIAALGTSSAHLLEMKPAAKPMRWLWAALGVLILATPLGVLAGGTAWGEWSTEQLQASLGYVPAGLERLGPMWSAAIPGYAPAFVRDPLLGYAIAAVLGVALAVGVTWVAGRLLFPARRGHHRSLARRTADAIGAAVSDVIENEELASSPGLLQGLDPRVKLLALLVVAVAASFTHTAAVLAGVIALTLALAAVSRVPVASFARKVWASAGVFGALLALPAATFLITPGVVVVPLGPLSLTAPGLLAALTLVLRVVASAGFALLVIWTTRWADALAALSAMHIPDVVVATLAMTQKQIVSLMRTVEQLHLARESRTLSAGTAAENRSWVVGRMAFVVKKSIKTADDVYDAMLARGFSGSMHTLGALSATARDWLWLGGVIAVCALSLGIDRMVISR